MKSAPTLSLTLHLWGDPAQPVRLQEESWFRCHEPIFDVLDATPALVVGMVLSGELLGRWEGLNPERLDRVRALVDAGQLELLGVPLFEPVLSAIPGRDAIDQILGHATLVKRVFEQRPRGCWLPRGVWDPTIPRLLARAEMDWCLVEDGALRAAGVPEPAWGTFVTDRAGYPLKILVADGHARIASGEGAPATLIERARTRASQGVGVQAWAWPAHRFGRRAGRDPETDSAWLLALLEDLAAADDLDLVLPSDAVGRSARGRVYLPSWAPEPERVPWERHLLAAAEADRLHKKMLRVSRLVNRLDRQVAQGAHSDTGPDPDRLVQAQRYLHRAQAHDAYEDRSPGGLYDPRVRGRAWHDVLRAERVAHRALGSAERRVAETADLGVRGHRDVLLRTPELCCVVEPHASGGLSELSLIGLAHNLVDVVTRPDEDRRVRLSHVEHLLTPDADVASVHARSPETHDPWTLITTERRDEIVRAVLSRDATVEGDDGAPGRVRLTKTYTLRPGPRLDWSLELQNRETTAVRLRVAVELCLRPAVGLHEVGLRVREQVVPAAESFEAAEVEVVDLRGAEVAGRVSLRPAGRIHALPLRTAHGDQGLSLFLEWPVPLLGREKHRLRVKLEQLP